jgi:hypothetical protein
MSLIEISNLNTAGSDLFAGADSFLTELEKTDTNQIFGGGGYGGGGYGGGGYKKPSYKKHSYKKHSYKKHSYKKHSYGGKKGW